MLHTSSPWPVVTNAIREALAQIGEHTSLLSEQWRGWLHEALDSLDQARDDERGVLVMRAARAVAVIGATESAQAARFEARLIALSPSERDRVQSELEARHAELEEALNLSVAHLDCAIDDLMAEFRAQVALEPRGASAGYRQLLGDDVAGLLLAHIERSEQLVLELGEAACALVGVAMGALLPLRVSQAAPLVKLGQDIPSAQIEAAVIGVVAAHRDRTIAQLASVMRRLRGCISGARYWRSLGQDAADKRAGALRRTAQEFDALAESLERLTVPAPPDPDD